MEELQIDIPATERIVFGKRTTFDNSGPCTGYIVSAQSLALGRILSLTQFGYSGAYYKCSPRLGSIEKQELEILEMDGYVA